VIVFCFICKQHIDTADLDDFKARGHDATPVAQLAHGLVGAYKPVRALEAEVEPEIVECFENREHIDPERLAA
jgi:hypothetical protein